MDGLLETLPAAAPYGAAGALVFLALRFAFSARKVASDVDTRYRAEVADHERTQKVLDDERALRRQLQDEMGNMAAAMRRLEEKVAGLEQQVAKLTGDGKA
jgi:polyhydroxyalkanoate synthesis regulator phasin